MARLKFSLLTRRILGVVIYFLVFVAGFTITFHLGTSLLLEVAEAGAPVNYVVAVNSFMWASFAVWLIAVFLIAKKKVSPENFMRRHLRFRRAVNGLFLLIDVLILFSFLTLATGQLFYGVVVSDSMTPSIPRGSFLAVLKGTPVNGDIIVFRVVFNNQKMLVVHRIISVLQNGFTTKGDANPNADPWIVPNNAVIGKVALSIPLLGYLTAFIRLPLCFAMLLTTLAMVISFGWFFPDEEEEEEGKPKEFESTAPQN